MKILVSCFCILLFSSCASHFGSITTSSFEKHHQYVSVAIGTTSTHTFLGIGGLRKEALVYTAKKNMEHYKPLSSDERYANHAVDIKKVFWLLGSTTKVIVTADIIKFVHDSITEMYGPNYFIGKKSTSNFISIGDSVYYKENGFGVVISNKSKYNSYQILFQKNSESSTYKIRTLKEKSIFLISRTKQIKGFKVGNEVEMILNNFGTIITTGKGEVIALGSEFLLVKNSRTKAIERLDYNEVRLLQ